MNNFHFQFNLLKKEVETVVTEWNKRWMLFFGGWDDDATSSLLSKGGGHFLMLFEGNRQHLKNVWAQKWFVQTTRRVFVLSYLSVLAIVYLC